MEISLTDTLLSFHAVVQLGEDEGKMYLIGEPFYPQNHVGRGWGTRDGAMGAVRLPKILVLTIDDSVSAQRAGAAPRSAALASAAALRRSPCRGTPTTPSGIPFRQTKSAKKPSH